MGNQADPKFPEVMLDLYRVVEQCLVDRIGLSRNEAKDAATVVATEVWNQYAGLQLYVPVGRAIRISERDRELVEAFRRGRPKDELVREYGLSNASFYAILRRVRAVEGLAQLDLFDTGDAPGEPAA